MVYSVRIWSQPARYENIAVHVNMLNVQPFQGGRLKVTVLATSQYTLCDVCSAIHLPQEFWAANYDTFSDVSSS